MLNGWLLPAGTREFSTRYKPTDVIRVAQWTTLLTVLIMSMFPLLSWVGHKGGRNSAITLSADKDGDTTPSWAARGGARVAMSKLQWLKIVRRLAKFPAAR
jgi:hypothetical protein